MTSPHRWERDVDEQNADGFLDATEFPHARAFKVNDKNKDGKLNREEHLAIYRDQFAPNDSDNDGLITAADKKQRKR